MTSSGTLVQAGPPSSQTELAQRLQSKDFRVRVQAALLLGKTGEASALPALTSALRDESAAVRASAAAALGTFGDPAALSALRAARGDANAAVKRGVEGTIALLEKQLSADSAERKQATVLVKLDGVKARTGPNTPEALGAVAQASRQALRKIPGIALLHPSEDPAQAAVTHKRPVIVMQGSIADLLSEPQGDGFVVSVRVEFVVQSMPEYAIVGKLSGRASVTGDNATDQDAGGRVRVQEAAVGAAVDSALSRSREALLAAARA